MELINCVSAKELDDLYADWALTFEGTTTDEDNLNWLIKWFKDHQCPMVKERFYVVKGELMNKTYKLKGRTAYPDNCTIVCIKQEDLSDVDKIIIPRFELGGRWFTDIVDNNRRNNK